MKKLFFLLFVGILVPAFSFGQTMTTIAGTGAGGYSGDGGPATSATTNFPVKVAADDSGNIYFADNGNNVIRKINLSGIITTIAGTGSPGYTGDGGLATAATLNSPWGVAVDQAGNIFIADAGNSVVRRIDAITTIITTIAGNGTAGYYGDGGPALSASFNGITGIAVDVEGNIYLTDDNNNRIRKIDASTTNVSTIAGNGSYGFSGDGGLAVNATLAFPVGISVDANKNVYLADSDNNRIRKIDTLGFINTIAGNGGFGYNGDGIPATSATLANPWDVIPDANGNIYIADFYNCKVRKVDANTGLISTYAGTSCGFADGPISSARMNAPIGLCFTPNGNLIICDSYSNRLRKVTPPCPPTVSNTCATAINLGVGATTYSVTPGINGPITWFKWKNNKNMVSFAFQFSNATPNKITRVETYIGSCSSLQLIAVDSIGFSEPPDTLFFHQLSKINPGTDLYFKVFSNITCGGAAPISGRIVTDNYNSTLTCNSPAPITSPCDIAQNGSLESLTSCPNNYSQIARANFWNDNPRTPSNTSTWNTCDIYAGCSSTFGIYTPVGNYCPNSGDVMAAAMASFSVHNYGREYLYNTLSTPMTSGKLYYVKFYTAASNWKYWIDAIGAYISVTTPTVNCQSAGGSYYNVTPQITNPAGSIIPGNCNANVAGTWTKINGCYTASGGEQYITLGNFVANGSYSATVNTCSVSNSPSQSYYFYDDLSVQEIDAAAGSNQTISCGQCVNLGQGTCSDPDITYSWAPSAGLGSTTTLTTTACPTVTTTYTLTVSLPSSSGPGCSYTSTVTITVNTPTVTVSASSYSICTGQTTTLTASGASSYTWSPASGLNTTTGSVVVASPTVTTTYTVITNPPGCNGSTVVTITVNPVPIVTAPSYTICKLSSATVTATGASTYTWAPAGTLSSSTGNPVVASPTATTVYTVTGTSSAGCQGTTTFTVTIKQLPILNVTSNTVLCSSAPTVTANPQVNGPSPQWYPPSGATMSCTACTSPIVTVSNPGSYVFTVTTTGLGTPQCTNTGTVSITVNPIPVVSVNSPSICPGQTVTLVASGTFGSTYSWLPGNATGATHTVSPNNTSTYTVTATLNNCTNTATSTVTVNPAPTAVGWTTRPCSGTTSTVSINGQPNVNYSWTPTVTCQNSSCTTVVLTPTAGVPYVITATNSFGCTKTFTLSPFTSPGLTVAATPSVLCTPTLGGPVSTILTATTSFSAGNQVTWTPAVTCSGICHTATATVTGNTTFTASTMAGNGCVTTQTLSVLVVPPPTVTVNSPSVCTGSTATLTASPSSLSYSWSPGLSSTTGTTVTGTPSVTTTYTVTGTLSGCSSSAVATVSIIPPASITITPTAPNTCNYVSPGSNTVCAGTPVTLTAASNPPQTSFTWTPGPFTGNPVVVTPNVTTTYTVVSSGAGCGGTQTITLNVSTCTCTGTPLGPVLTNATINGGTFAVQPGNTVTLNGNNFFNNVTINLGANAVINVNGTLTMTGCHLSACGNMWQGIIVQPGGAVTATGNTLIEDAIVAIDNGLTNSNVQTAGAPGKIIVRGAIFNCNRTSIRKAFYKTATTSFYSTSYFNIDNAVFTCRCGLPTAPTTTMLTVYSNTVTGTPSIPNPDLFDYFSVANYPAAFLKPPFPTNTAAFEGIRLEDVGPVPSASITASPFPYLSEIGQAGGRVVLFDNLVYGINVINSTFSVSISAFQKPQQILPTHGNNPAVGGYGIQAINNRCDLRTGIYVTNNRFIDVVRGIHSLNYYDIHADNNTLFATRNILAYPLTQPSGFPIPGGDYGFFFQTYKFVESTPVPNSISNNRMADVNNGIVFSITSNTCLPVNGQFVADLLVSQNTLTAQFNSNYPNKFVGTGIAIVNSLPPVTINPPSIGAGTSISVTTNSIANAFNGISVNGLEYQRIRDENNTIEMQQWPTISTEPYQYGITHMNCIYHSAPGYPNSFGDDIFNNSVTGYFPANTTYTTVPFTTFEKKLAIWSRNCSNHYVTCNTVVNSGRGFAFDGLHGNTFWAMNTMSSSGEGYCLINSGVIGTQSTTPNNAIDNQWLNTAGSFADTYTDASSAPGSSILYIRNVPTYTPTSNQTGGVAYSSPASLNVVTAASSYGCSVPPMNLTSQGSTGPISARNTQSTLSTNSGLEYLEAIVQDSVQYQSYYSQNTFNNKNYVYRLMYHDSTLHGVSAILDSFYLANAQSSWSLFCLVDDSLGNGGYSYAAALINSFMPTCTIEQNYQRYYQIYINGLTSVLTGTDSSDLELIASSCPLLNGNVVFQARALHTALYQEFINYEDNCPQDNTNGQKIASILSDNTSELILYPNPTNGKITIAGFTALNKTVALEVTDITGKLIQKQSTSVAGGLLDMEMPLNNGVYFLKIIVGGKTSVKKVVVNR